jgi:hypothetical protein
VLNWSFKNKWHRRLFIANFRNGALVRETSQLQVYLKGASVGGDHGWRWLMKGGDGDDVHKERCRNSENRHQQPPTATGFILFLFLQPIQASNGVFIGMVMVMVDATFIRVRKVTAVGKGIGWKVATVGNRRNIRRKVVTVVIKGSI